MKKEINEVKDAIYTGMCIYDKLKISLIELSGKKISLEDKKYISLYLGILYSKNSISEKLQKKIYKDINYSNLNIDELTQVYINNFIDILIQVDFTSITNYFNFLLSNEVVNSINKNYGINIDNSNKKLIKQ